MSISAQCPGCGAPIVFHVSSSVATVCESCNTLVARTDRSIESLGRTADLLETQSPLALRVSGSFHGAGFLLAGRAQLRHGAGGVWDEWYLAFDDGRWGWLAEAQGRFYLTFRQAESGTIYRQGVVAGYPIDVGNPPTSMVVAETGEAEILAGRGEIPYRLEVGRRYWYADLSGRGGAFGTLDFGEEPPALFLGREVTLAELGIAGTAADHAIHGQVYGDGVPHVQQVSAEAVTCDNCGGALELYAPEVTERVACPYCGSMHECNRGALRLLNAARLPPVESDIELGSKGQFEGQTFTIIGFMTRSVTSDWGIFDWSEYLLYNPRLGFRWLTHSDEHWTYLKPVPIGEIAARRPDNAHYPGEVAEYGGKSYKIFQASEATVQYVAGEFYWQVEVGQTAYTADYVDPPEMLSGEYARGEINWSLGTYMTRMEVVAAFDGLALPSGAPSTIAPNQPFRHKSVYPVWAILLALSVVALFWARIAHPNQQVYTQTYNMAPEKRRVHEPEVFFSERFELVGGENIEIAATAPRVNNSWVYIQGDLYNEKTGRVLAFDLPIEYYFGVEGGESWSEGGRSASKFLSAVAGGRYRLRVAIERSDFRRPSTVHLTVNQGVFRLFYWLVMLGLLSLIPIGVMIYHITFEHRRWVNSDFTGEE